MFKCSEIPIVSCGSKRLSVFSVVTNVSQWFPVVLNGYHGVVLSVSHLSMVVCGSVPKIVVRGKTFVKIGSQNCLTPVPKIVHMCVLHSQVL